MFLGLVLPHFSPARFRSSPTTEILEQAMAEVARARWVDIDFKSKVFVLWRNQLYEPVLKE